MRGYVHIDGSRGEGGGQMLRTSLTLALLTGKSVRVTNLRAGREPSGLRPQHLAAVLAAGEVGQTEVEGLRVGSRELVFSPGIAAAGEYHFDVGTAGSAVLVLQTVLPALLLADGPSTVEVQGGTYNTHAPSFDFFARTYLPLLHRMGARASVKLVRPGFYPAGGGLIRAEISPCARLEPLHLGPRTKCDVSARAFVARLPLGIAKRELDVVGRKLDIDFDHRTAEELRDAKSPGNAVFIEIDTGEVTEIVTGYGERGVLAETVAEGAAAEAREFLDSAATVGEHLADQLLLPIALAGAGSFLTSRVSSHARTNMEVIAQFLGTKFQIREVERASEVSLATSSR